MSSPENKLEGGASRHSQVRMADGKDLRTQVVDQCRAVAYLARQLADIYNDIATTYAVSGGGERILRAKAHVTGGLMETLGDILNGMDAVIPGGDWLTPIFEASHAAGFDRPAVQHAQASPPPSAPNEASTENTALDTSNQDLIAELGEALFGLVDLIGHTAGGEIDATFGEAIYPPYRKAEAALAKLRKARGEP